MSETHTLKVEKAYFKALETGQKNFEVRRDDRGFQKGDKIILCKYGRGKVINSQTGFLDEWGEVVSSYPNQEDVAKVERTITYILTGGQFGIEPGYVVLGLGDPSPPTDGKEA